MTIPDNIAEIVDHINKTLPVHTMWDGFWIYAFKKQTLTISCSIDRVYYRNFDYAFKKVIFFNIPAEWRDTQVDGDNLLRLSNKEEFAAHHPDFDPLDNVIIAIDLYFYRHELEKSIKHTFFIVCRRVYLHECQPPNNDSGVDYEEYFTDEHFPCKKNRVLA